MNYLVYFLILGILVYWVERPSVGWPNSLMTRKDPALELEAWLKQFNWSHRFEIQDSGALPRYKFYSDVIEILLKLARKMGGNYQGSFLFLREGLLADRQFEKSARDALIGIWLQMALVMGITWTFILSALSMVESTLTLSSLFLILAWQLTGLGVLPLVLKKLRQKYFSDIGKLWKILFVLKSLGPVPLPRSEVLSYAGIQELKHIQQPALLTLVEKLKESCQRCLKEGISYETDVEYLMDELRFQEKFHFKLFEKRLTVLKLILLSVFFLPSYLAFIFLLLGDLMALM